MEDDDVQSLNEQLLDDDDLRARFREDPAGVVADAGIDLNDKQEARLLAEDWPEKTDDEVLAVLRDRGISAWF
jgi:hypothetical protein